MIARVRSMASGTAGRHCRVRWVRPALVSTFALAAAGAVARPLPDISKVQRGLDGTWASDGLTVHINIDRMQANVDASRPFQWDAFHLVDVSGKLVTFDIGSARFFGLQAPDGTLVVTRAGSDTQYALHRLKR